MRKISLISFLILLVFASSLVVAADNDPLKDKVLYSTNVSWLPRIAVDPDSGTMAIIWSVYNWDNYTGDKVLIAFATPQGKSFKLGKARVVAAPATNASIVYNSKNKQFFVVWTTLPIDDWKASEIKGRFYNLKGQSVGGSLTYDSPGIAADSPYVVYNSDNNEYLLLWSRGSLLISQGSYSGLYSMVVDGNGVPKFSPKKIRNEVVFGNLVYVSEPIAGKFNAKSGRNFVVVQEDTPQSKTTILSNYFLYVMDNSGNIKKRAKIEQTTNDGWSIYASMTEQTADKKSYHYITLVSEKGLSVRKVSRKGGLQGAPITFPKVKDAYGSSIAYCPEEEMYCLLSWSSQGIQARFLDAQGKELTKKPFSVSKSKADGRPFVAWNPVYGKFMVTWIQEVNQTSRKVWLSTLEPPDLK